MTEITDYNKDLSERILSQVREVMKDTYNDILGLKFLTYQEGFCRAVLPVRQEFLNPNGSLHGGLLYTIADTVGGVAALRPDSGESVTTITGTMQFYRAALNLTSLYAEGRMVKDGKRVAFVEVALLSEDGTLYARGSFSFARIDFTGKIPEQ